MSDPATNSIARSQRSMLLLFGMASLPAIAAGAFAMQQDGHPLSLWIRNPAAWLVAGALSILVIRSRRLPLVMPPLALAMIALSFLGPGQEGVHRWIGLGPIQFNAAALVLPAAIAAFAADRLGLISFAFVGALLAAQPDISQLAGFALASVILCAARFGWKGALGSTVIAAAAIAFCLSRPDPLEPVSHVEGIFLLAWGKSFALGSVMAASLVCTALLPLLFRKNPKLKWSGGAALAAYFAATALAPAFGAYPVPLAGYGLSFVIGWWLGIAALAGLRASPDATIP